MFRWVWLATILGTIFLSILLLASRILSFPGSILLTIALMLVFIPVILIEFQKGNDLQKEMFRTTSLILKWTKAILPNRITRKRRSRTWSDALANSRAHMTLAGIGLLIASVAVHVILTARFDYVVLSAAALAAGVVVLDVVLLSWRVRRGLYGDNRAEAGELLHFISARGKGGDSAPPRRAVRDPLEAREGDAVAAADAIGGH